jgi:hypothetical protein
VANFPELFNLSVEEQAQFALFKREIDLLSAVPTPVKSEKEISTIETTLNQFVQELVERVSEPNNKTDT